MTLVPYRVSVNGMGTVLLLSEEDAKERGLTDADKVRPAAKARTAPNKAARTAANKGGAAVGRE
jgi:hypothetical protein